LVDIGQRWNVQAFNGKSSEFCDFVITRIKTPLLLDGKQQAYGIL
jgi:predicted DNA-binding transcriptional regulator YafY